jgi:hypothetical protein
MAQHRAQSEDGSRRRRFVLGWSTRSKIISGVLGATLVGVSAYAVTNWVVSLGSGSHGQAQSATVSNITISAVASPSPSNLLFPGGNGDVVAQITNPNSFPVTLTAVNLPTNTTYAAGFSDSGLSSAQSGCDSTTSLVSWRFATGSSGSSHTLTTAITVDASSNVTVTFTNDAAMGLSTPAACENTYFQMPSLTGVAATGGAATPSSGPLTDSWTS